MGMTFRSVACLVFWLVVGGCTKGDNSPVPEGKEAGPDAFRGRGVQASSIATIEVTTGSSQPLLVLAGRVVYGEDRYSKISSPIPGRVLEVRTKLGDPVEAGDVLLVINSPEIASAYADFFKEHSELTYAKRAYALAKELYAIKVVAQKDLKRAESDLVKAIAEFRRSKERLLTLNIPATELNKPLHQQRVSSHFLLRSSLMGRVVERSVTPGQAVGKDPGEVLFVVADLDQLQFVADVYERDLELLEVGQTGAVTVEAYREARFPAVVSRIGDVVDPVTRTIKVRARVDNADLKLKPNMFGRLELNRAEGGPVPQIPKEAVLENEGRTYVFVEEDTGRYIRRPVHVRPARDGDVAVLEGLVPGERVVVRGAVLLKQRHSQ